MTLPTPPSGPPNWPRRLLHRLRRIPQAEPPFQPDTDPYAAAPEFVGPEEEWPADASLRSEGREPRQLDAALQRPGSVLGIAAVGLLTLAAFYTLALAKAFFLPLVIAVLFNFLLSPLVTRLRRIGVPASVGAVLVLALVLGLLGWGLYQFAAPAAEWMDEAPERLREVEYKLRGVKASLEKVQETTQEIERLADGGEAATQEAAPVQVREATFSNTLMNLTRDVLFSIVVLVFLVYFLLASDDLFLRKFVRVLPVLRSKRNAVAIIRRTEQDLSRYFVTTALINAGLGLAVGAALYALGMPNPLLWGALAGVLNFIPYLGGLLGIVIISLVAIVSFDELGRAVLAPLAYLVLNTIEAYAITPAILGRRLLLNPVAVFVSIIFWGWLWGVPGAILAVPLLVSFKIICDNVAALAAVGEFLGR